jgi:hypothetical protein
VKGPLVAEMFNIAGFHLPGNLAARHSAAILTKLDWAHPRLQPLGHDRRLYNKVSYSWLNMYKFLHKFLESNLVAGIRQFTGIF